VVWTRADDSRHAYADSDPGITLSDVVTPYNATLRGAALHIHEVKRSDQITFICTLVNSLGHSNVTFFVRVKGARKIPA